MSSGRETEAISGACRRRDLAASGDGLGEGEGVGSTIL